MSLTTALNTATATADGQAQRWQRWQRTYAKSSRRTAIQARIVCAVMLTGTTAWLALQLFLEGR